VSIPIDPRFIDATRWVAETTILLAPFGTVPKLLDPEHWREWASVVVALPSVAAVNAPRPEGFATWDAWARAFNVTARLLAV
jgi:hypothetical protein